MPMSDEMVEIFRQEVPPGTPDDVVRKYAAGVMELIKARKKERFGGDEQHRRLNILRGELGLPLFVNNSLAHLDKPTVVHGLSEQHEAEICGWAMEFAKILFNAGYHTNLRYWTKANWDWITEIFESSYQGQRFLDHAWRIQLELDGLVEDLEAELGLLLSKALAKPSPTEHPGPSAN